MSKSGPTAVQPLGYGSAGWVRSCSTCRKRRPGDELIGVHAAAAGQLLVTRIAGRPCILALFGPEALASRGTSEDDSALPEPGLAALAIQQAGQGAAHAPRQRGTYLCPSNRCAAAWVARMDRGRGATPGHLALLQAVRAEALARIAKRSEGLARRHVPLGQDGGLRCLNGLVQALSEPEQGPRSAKAGHSRRGETRA